MTELISMYCFIFCIFASSGIAFALAWRMQKDVKRMEGLTQYILYCMIEEHGYKYMKDRLEEWQEAMEGSDLDETD